MKESWVNEPVRYVSPEIYMIVERADNPNIKYVDFDKSEGYHVEIINISDFGETYTKEDEITFALSEYQGNIGVSFEIDGDIYISRLKINKNTVEDIVKVAWENTKRRLMANKDNE